ncbi:MAG: HlyC/CorC family transporter [Bacteroidetes bacterium]|nr:MAG: HlyC/CorC family transporter [Bacteroidota bacterium]REK04968.1 MAG: HlyC/CorC family transporter [Bacteroidota bacterium]REK36528.1 MAG: HlyC/CorC family transporter [Bacteroidota bacterium]REK50894.1 MAG: HlyC/CorC family transporter [Bacteroidota bacterium]
MSDWAIIICSLLISALASGSEIAFLSANKLRIELDRSQGSFAAKLIWGHVKSPSRFIATILVANNIALVVYGTVMAKEILAPENLRDLLPHQLQSEAGILFTQTIVSTLIILVTAEFLPKVLFRINPNGILKFLAVPIQIIYGILKPLVWVVLGLSRFILKNLLRVNFVEERPVFGRVDLDLYIRDITTRNSQVEEMDTEMRIFQNALDFKEVKIRECMIPRKEIVAIDVNEPIEELKKLFIETKLSKILVYRDSIDNIIGFVHSSEMFKRPNDITQILIPVSIVPEVMTANDLLKQFTNQHRSVAIVVDEFGGTSGMVTIEDLIEEIFGEIQDEHDIPEEIEKKISDTEYLLSGRLEIDYLNKKYDLAIPEHESYETLGGFIFHNHENIPLAGEEIIIPPFTITALKVMDNKIIQARIRINREE